VPVAGKQNDAVLVRVLASEAGPVGPEDPDVELPEVVPFTDPGGHDSYAAFPGLALEGRFVGAVGGLERALEARDAGWLARWIGEAGGNRRRLLAEAYEDPGTMQRVRVHVPDRPGVLSGITQALGADKINIEDFELDHLSPDRGGTLDVLVAGEEAARRAADLLEAQGYSVIVSPAFED